VGGSIMARVLQQKEICHKKEFCEFRYGIEAGYESIGNILRWLKNPNYSYGKTWRCWNKKVPIETMKATPWN
jgi:hypothetical protein